MRAPRSSSGRGAAHRDRPPDGRSPGIQVRRSPSQVHPGQPRAMPRAIVARVAVCRHGLYTLPSQGHDLADPGDRLGERRVHVGPAVAVEVGDWPGDHVARRPGVVQVRCAGWRLVGAVPRLLALPHADPVGEQPSRRPGSARCRAGRPCPTGRDGDAGRLGNDGSTSTGKLVVL